MEMNMETDDIENAQMSPNDMLIYKSCPVWEEFILVKCQYCNSFLLPHSIKNHVEVRHTGTQQYEKDPLSSIFCKVVKEEKKPTLPTILSSTLTPRASTTAYGIQGSQTSCSVNTFSADMSPRVAEQCRGWPNSPHGAYQQSPLNMTTNFVKVKNENSKVIPPGYSGEMGSNVSILAKNHKSMLELSASIPEMKPEPYNQSFSFSSTPNIMPPTSALASSRDMPSTSYGMLSTSKGLLPCQSLPSSETGYEGCMIYSTDLQSSSTDATGSLEHSQPKTPKIVLRRVLQPNPKAPAEGSRSHQDWKRFTKNPKDKQDSFMVVHKKEQRKLKLQNERIEKRKRAK